MNLRCAVAAGDRLGDGAFWAPAEGRVYWFDVQGKRLAWFDPIARDAGGWTLEMRASAGAPLTAGGLLVATEKGLATFDTERAELVFTETVNLGDGFRACDGKVDPWGRFWWSVVQDAGLRPGQVLRTDPGRKTVSLLGGIHVPRGLCVSPDGKTLYVADAKLQTVFAHAMSDYADIRLFTSLQGQTGTVMGMAMDDQGFLWTCQPGASRVVRFAPDGAVDRTIPLPVSHPISCAFGGEDLGTLFVTTAREGVPLNALAHQRDAGGLFAFETGVRGMVLPAFNNTAATAH